MFWKLDLFPSSGDGRRTPTLLGPLGTADLNHPVTRYRTNQQDTNYANASSIYLLLLLEFCDSCVPEKMLEDKPKNDIISLQDSMKCLKSAIHSIDILAITYTDSLLQ
jgi:hypothetical protein